MPAFAHDFARTDLWKNVDLDALSEQQRILNFAERGSSYDFIVPIDELNDAVPMRETSKPWSDGRNDDEAIYFRPRACSEVDVGRHFVFFVVVGHGSPVFVFATSSAVASGGASLAAARIILIRASALVKRFSTRGRTP